MPRPIHQRRAELLCIDAWLQRMEREEPWRLRMLLLGTLMLVLALAMLVKLTAGTL